MEPLLIKGNPIFTIEDIKKYSQSEEINTELTSISSNLSNRTRENKSNTSTLSSTTRYYSYAKQNKVSQLDYNIYNNIIYSAIISFIYNFFIVKGVGTFLLTYKYIDNSKKEKFFFRGNILLALFTLSYFSYKLHRTEKDFTIKYRYFYNN